MQVFLAVIADLFHFAQNALFGSYVLVAQEGTAHHEEKSVSLPHETQLSLPTFQSVRSVLEEKNFVVTEELENGETYFIASADAALFSDPVHAFDTKVAPLNYGTSVTVTKRGGRWAHVRTTNGDGWVLRDMLAEHEAEVFPVFHHGSFYDATHTETQKLRKLIQDAFFGGGAHLALTGAEYVLYRQRKAGREVHFGTDRPRSAGTWQKLLRGKYGVHIGIHPKEGSVMEYSDGSMGHLAYIEALLPDESIRVFAVGVASDGEYTESFISKEMWLELHPVFIEFR